jgi:hypothetical protein
MGSFCRVIDNYRFAGAEPVLPAVGDVCRFTCCGQCVEVVEDGLRPINEAEAVLRDRARLTRLLKGER